MLGSIELWGTGAASGVSAKTRGELPPDMRYCASGNSALVDGTS